MRTFSALIVASGLCIGLAGKPALAQVEVGMLRCTGAQTSNFIFGSTTQMQCRFHSRHGAQNYIATVHHYGVDLGVTQRSIFLWKVLAPTARVGRGDLTGSYGGVSGSAAVGIGAGANLLIGGSNNTVALQPLSVEGQTGLNVNASITQVELRGL